MATSNHPYDMPPGTERMSEDGKAEKALIPVPSTDPHDPLNWSTTWKCKYLSAHQYVPSLILNSRRNGQPVDIYLDICHRRLIYCPHVSALGKGVSPEQFPTLLTDWHHRHHSWFRELRHRPVEQHLWPPSNQLSVFCTHLVDMRLGGSCHISWQSACLPSSQWAGLRNQRDDPGPDDSRHVLPA